MVVYKIYLPTNLTLLVPIFLYLFPYNRKLEKMFAQPVT
jgi:hypothetical protein